MNQFIKAFSVQFVEYMPELINQGELYISMKYSVVIHLCACGCGEKVVTPLSPDDWQLKYDGETISLYPSIGNWDFPCQSHYWIRRSKVINAERWDEQEIQYGNKRAKKHKSKSDNAKSDNQNSFAKISKKKEGWGKKLKSLFSF